MCSHTKLYDISNVLLRLGALNSKYGLMSVNVGTYHRLLFYMGAMVI